ncbi:ParA family partition ATPase [Rhodovibrionaceae bacterium A322]
MAGKVITVAQQKGGAGKTSLAAHLGVALQSLGRTVALLDIDPQGSLAAWGALRTSKGLGLPLIEAAKGWQTRKTVDGLVRDHEFLIIDTPPHAETEARLAIRAATLVLMPLQPSPMDLWAIRPTLDLVSSEGGSALAVLNRVPPRSRLVAETLEALGEQEIPVADSQLGNRVAFAAALSQGQGAVEYGGAGKAKTEILDLAQELLGRL